MRTAKDRLRHAISFELIALFIVTPVGALAFSMPLHTIGIVTVISAAIATGWNYLYNLMFDRFMLRWAGHIRKTWRLRVGHALAFEAGLLIVLIPFIALALNVSLLTAFLMDVSFSAFYLVYAFIFNWAYDVIFPVSMKASREKPI
jgi:uncharacterized membrane protein